MLTPMNNATVSNATEFLLTSSISSQVFIRFPSLWIVQMSSSHEIWSDQHGNYYFLHSENYSHSVPVTVQCTPQVATRTQQVAVHLSTRNAAKICDACHDFSQTKSVGSVALWSLGLAQHATASVMVD